jgi:hypothetical protein
MSHEEDKIRHSERIHQKQVKIKKQLKIAKAHNADSKWKYVSEPHRNHKTHIFNCGNPKCVMCMNPRKSFGEKTIQELRFDQPAIHDNYVVSKD